MVPSKEDSFATRMINSVMSQSRSNSNQTFLATIHSLWLQRESTFPCEKLHLKYFKCFIISLPSQDVQARDKLQSQCLLLLPSFEFCTLFHTREYVSQYISTTEMLCSNLVPESELILAVCGAHGSKEKSTHNQ